MKLDPADRRRLVFASALTVVALPAMWLANNDRQRDGSAVPNLAAVGIEAGDAVGGAPDAPVAEAPDPLAPDDSSPDPLFLEGPLRGPSATGQVAVAAATPEPGGPSVAMEATFRRTVGSSGSCLVNGVPAGISVTVVNLENGRSIDCWTGPLASGTMDQIVLHPDGFQELANFTAAPVPVEVRW